MTSWQDIQQEIASGRTPDKPTGDFDVVRRAKYKLVSQITGRSLLVYATAFHNPIKAQIATPLLSIDLSDKDGFYEIIRNIESSEVDIFLHSPGGSAEATESIVKMLRSKFKIVRFIVTGGQTDTYFVTEHEYILVYAKSQSFQWIDEIIPVDEARFNKQDERGKFVAVKLAKWGSGARREDRPKMYFPIKSPDRQSFAV